MNNRDDFRNNRSCRTRGNAGRSKGNAPFVPESHFRIRGRITGVFLVLWIVPLNGTMGYAQKGNLHPPPQKEEPSYYSFLTKDLTRLIPARTFSKSDRIYLYTTWTGLKGLHEIKVLWIRPDKKVQETVRIKEKPPSNTPNYSTWAWLSFKKGLLNLSSSEGIFIGPWTAKLYLDGELLKEYEFSIY